uniref:Rieske-like [2Fe-2S] domain-containing protein n=1 Tax=Octactis speculum TaxID=3111310 RepID=A0A7S2FJC2_9STRA
MNTLSLILTLALVGSTQAFVPSGAISNGVTRAMPSKVSMMAGKALKKGTKVMKFVDALPVSELPKPGTAKGAICGGLDVCIAVGTDGLIYALGNKAPPTGSPLKDGKVGTKTIKDAQFGTEFDLETGDVVGKWCPGGIGFLVGKLYPASSVPTYKVKKTGKSIQVEVDVNYKLDYEKNYWRGVLDAQGKTDGGYY